MMSWRAFCEISFRVTLCCALVWLSGCGSKPDGQNLSADATWEEILDQARGQTVRLSMWDGDPMINAYMRDYVIPELKTQHGVTLQLIGGQGNNIVSKLMVDMEAKRTNGDIDLVWINGETFYQLRKMNGLFGPFTERLPNNRFIDWTNPFVAIDFQQPVEGYECPWGNVQLAIIYNIDAIGEPPKGIDELAAWIKGHPGRFTFDNSFTGMTFLKSLLYEFAGGPQSLNGPFDEARYTASAAKLWLWLKDVKPFLWREGKTFPDSVSQLHQLFNNSEVDFTMSNNDGEVDNKVLQGVLPATARGYVLDSGTIRNSHYLGIPFNASNKAGTLVVANFLISPDAQLRKATPAVWGDGTVLSIDRLPEEWRQKFARIDGRERIAPREDLEKKALLEPAAEIMVRLHADFRREIIEDAR
jgi:putative spermidine/putrescine transport system substrate-binding protein